MKSHPLKKLLLSFLLIFATNTVFSQGWEKTFGGIGGDKGFSVQQTTDGGYIIAGQTQSVGASATDVYLIKTDANGDTLWTKTFGGISGDAGYSVAQTIDEGYIIVGITYSFGAGYDVYLIKTNTNGNTLWTKTFGGTNYDYCYFVHQTTDMGYIIVGYTESFGAGLSDVYLIRTDVNGTTLWTKTFGGTGNDYGNSVKQTTDGGYVIVGTTTSFGAGQKDVYLIKTDVNGDTLWTKTFGGTVDDYGNSVKQTTDGGYIITGTTTSFGVGQEDVYLIKTDVNGDTFWTKTFGGSSYDYGYSVLQTTDGGYGVIGSIGAGSYDVYLIKTDANGNTLWTKIFGGITFDIGYSVQQTCDKGYIIVGETRSFGAGYPEPNIYLIKTDSLGNTVTNTISGFVFNDANGNCQKDGNEISLKDRIVKITPSEKYVSTDSNGFYTALIGTGTYTVELVDQHPYYQQICPVSPNTYTVNFTQHYDTSSNNNFGQQISIYCPLMWVDISTGITRPCRNNTYTVNYCNKGTISANNAFIEIEFDEKLIPMSSTIPWSSVTGNKYRFDLGSVTAGYCGTFYITDSVSCNAAMNSTLCVSARIYPDTICTPADPNWDKSSIKVEANCIGDSVRFVIYNTGDAGNGDMDGTSQYRIYINDSLSFSTTFQLKGQDSLEVYVLVCGNAIRLEADQRPGHPGNSRPRETIEGCGAGGCGTARFGFVNTVAEDDADLFVEKDCQTVRTSYDPNEKLIKPTGVTMNRYVKNNDELEYHINFQNTGNDTAFLIVVRDTIGSNFDISTVQSGSSSHPYSFRIYDQGILEWKFKNIFLPDSNINSAKSHGYVNYKVKQKAGLAPKTLIENRATIYFDYTAPVITKMAWVRVEDTSFTTKTKNISIAPERQYSLKIFPNPMNHRVFIEISDSKNNSTHYQNFELYIYDVLGQEVSKFKLQTGKTIIPLGNLPSGIYIYQVRKDKELIENGKWVVE